MKRYVIIVILVIISIGNATSQVRLAFNCYFDYKYHGAILYDALIKLKGDDWTYKNVVVPLLKQPRKLMYKCLIYYDGKVQFFKVGNNPSDEILDALNEVATYLEQTQTVMIGAYEFYDFNNLESTIQKLLKDAIETNKLKLVSLTKPPTAEDSLIYYNIVKEQYRTVPIFSGFYTIWPHQIIDDYELHKSEFEEQDITIMQYLKQEVDKILSQPLPKSTLDYGITNEDFWPIKEDDKE